MAEQHESTNSHTRQQAASPQSVRENDKENAGWQPALRGYTGRTSWSASTGEITFQSSGSMPEGKEDFFWEVPREVKRIKIAENVTFHGGFRVKYRPASEPLTIEGADRKTSIIHGTEERQWTESNGVGEGDKWRYGSISVIEDAVARVSNLTSKNPRGYHMSGYANQAGLHVERCDLIDTRGGENNNSDGFFGRAGSSIRDCFISTLDDAIKVYEDITIEDVTIEQHRNGAALQFGWTTENTTANARVKNLTIKGVANDDRYNMAPLTWEVGDRGVRNVRIEELNVEMHGKMYSESEQAWVPIGLLELKPLHATFNLTVVQPASLQSETNNNPTLAARATGIINTTGEVRFTIDPSLLYPHLRFHEIPFHRVVINDPFWSPRIRQVQQVTLPDLFSIAKEQGKIDNFRIVAGRKTDGNIRLYNAPDSDVYKLMEAAAYTLAVYPDEETERKLDELIELVEAAQQPDGYINTQYTLPDDHPQSPNARLGHIKTFGYGIKDRWSSRAENWPYGYSQMYCAGHLFEAAVAHHRATGKRSFLDVATRLADHMIDVFDDAKLKGYADHPQVEIGLMKLYEVTGDTRYQQLADRIVRRLDFGRPPDIGNGKSRLPLPQQREAFGHCVRTTYMYGGATDVIRASGANDLKVALDSIWRNLVGHKMYVHGGVGNGTRAEQHGEDDDLPIHGLYCESCASIATAQWNHRLNLMRGDAAAADLVELEAYNSALSGISADGTKYFYTNLLNVSDSGRNNQHHGLRSRYLFCCPAKLPGFVAGIGRWIYSQSQDSIIVNQYINSSTQTAVDDVPVSVKLTSAMPWKGGATLKVGLQQPRHRFAVRMRIPGWLYRPGPLPSDLYHFADTGNVVRAASLQSETNQTNRLAACATVTVNGEPFQAAFENGYAVIERAWQDGDRIDLAFDLPIRRVRADQRVKQQQGYVSLARGPLVYAIEGIDNEFDEGSSTLEPAQLAY